MTKDPIDYVRQGAMISLALVLMQTSKDLEPRVEAVFFIFFRFLVGQITKMFQSKIEDKHEEVLSKMACHFSHWNY